MEHYRPEDQLPDRCKCVPCSRPEEDDAGGLHGGLYATPSSPCDAQWFSLLLSWLPVSPCSCPCPPGTSFGQFRYAGVEDGDQCFCGDVISPKTVKPAASNNMKCTGDPTKMYAAKVLWLVS